MTYKVELKAAIDACTKVHDAEQGIKHLDSYRLEAGKRIRAAYIAGKAEGKSKADVAKDIGFSASWVRELANNDTEEKVIKAKKKVAARVKKHAKKSKSPLANGGQHNGHAEPGNADNVPDPEKKKTTEDTDEALEAYKIAWLEHCLPHVEKMFASGSDKSWYPAYNEPITTRRDNAEDWMKKQIQKIKSKLAATGTDHIDAETSADERKAAYVEPVVTPKKCGRPKKQAKAAGLIPTRSDRELLLSHLEQLGSNMAHEVSKAATHAEKLRARLGMSWGDLVGDPDLVPHLKHFGSDAILEVLAGAKNVEDLRKCSWDQLVVGVAR